MKVSSRFSTIIFMSDIICVTNRNTCSDDFLQRIESIAACQPKALVLREKDLTEAEYLLLAEKVMNICGARGVKCILHSFADVAVKLGADALHMPLPALRRMSETVRQQFRILGASCHSINEAIEAEKLGCTYITAGHIFPTDCKKRLAGRGLDFLQEVCSSVSIPVYAIGGINAENINLIAGSAASGACIMSGFMECGNIDQYFKKLRKQENNMNFMKKSLQFYAVTDRAGTDFETLYKKIEDGLKGGVTIVQLREKNLDEDAFIEEAIKVKELCHRYNVPFIINDNVNVALKSGADGVHVGIEDQPVAEIRKFAGENFIIGATAKTIEQARNAEAAGADYLGVGAVFPSPTKKKVIRITQEQLKEICAAVSIPAVAIGGISIDNVDEIKGCGMCGVAVSSAIFAEEDVQTAAEELKKKIHEII